MQIWTRLPQRSPVEVRWVGELVRSGGSKDSCCLNVIYSTHIFTMGENEYGRLWDHLISDEPRKVAEAASSFTSPNHTSTPTTTASGAPSLSRGEKRKSEIARERISIV